MTLSPAVAGAHGGRGDDDDEQHGGPLAPTITLPGGLLSRPEGVASDGNNIYVGSVADGTVFKANRRANQAEVFLPAGGEGRTALAGMKVSRGRLYLCGANTGKIFVYDVKTRDLLYSTVVGQPGQAFINDVAIAPDGTAYFTDSFSPSLYRLSERRGVWSVDEFVNFNGTVFQYQPGFNANGIVISPNGKWALVAQSNTRKLFRVDLRNRDVTEVTIVGQVPGGDGLLLRGDLLYLVGGGVLSKLDINERFSRVELLETITNATFSTPTTVARIGDLLFVVNAQFAANPVVLPFTVTRLEDEE